MKRIIALVLSISLFGTSALADCEWSTGIKQVEGGYLYSNDCHGRVGVLVKDLEDRESEVKALREGLRLKDLALDVADKRTMLWREESYEQFDRLQKQIESSKKNDTLWFVLGIVVTGAAVWGAGQLR